MAVQRRSVRAADQHGRLHRHAPRPRSAGRPARRIPRAADRPTMPVTAETWPTIRTIIENRINQYGVAEPVVQTQGSDRIVVEIPGVTRRRGGPQADRLHRPARLRAESRRRHGVSEGTSSARPAAVPGQHDHHHAVRAVQRRPDRHRPRRASTRRPASAPSTSRSRTTGAHALRRTTRREQRPATQFAIVLDGIVQSAPSINAPSLRRQGPDPRQLHVAARSTTSSPS